ncbi:30S ribosomal protein S7 [Candidatus Cytomitobacter indipagum]|uniref:30S ribosomal protein S7 n=1 Tax=Candidatus Cytomitobacter indipagum TaxID=2601575 RepID=A0A5C0UDX6_9PROT|nr:30S ribosomal protein S7 [Candidatus Cytomitobacter indipagum]QEK38276.1 30S ribosomal protein S7 [Candidatus Cytomitobacter indipagum]
MSRNRKVNSISIFDKDPIGGFTNVLMKDGKKAVAEDIARKSFAKAGEELNMEPQKVAKDVLSKIKPLAEVKSRRVGGSTYPVPVDVRPKRAYMLASRWIIGAARSKKGMSMIEKLSIELINIMTDGKSGAIDKKTAVHNMVKANQAFAHLGSK